MSRDASKSLFGTIKEICHWDLLKKPNQAAQLSAVHVQGEGVDALKPVRKQIYTAAETLALSRAPWSPEESTRGGVASLPLQIFRHQASRWQSRLRSCSCPSGPKEGASLQTHRLRTCSKLGQESNE